MPSIRNYSVGAVVGIAVGLIGLGFQWKYPEQRWLGTWVAIFGFAILAITLVAYVSRWFTIREYERHHAGILESSPPVRQTASPRSEFNPRLDYKPQNVFNPEINVHVPVPQSQNLKSKAESTRDPVFECRGTRFRRYGLDTRTGKLIRQQYEGDPSQVYDYIRFVNVGLAKFLYCPDPGVDARLRVNAHVFIYDDDLPRTYQVTPAGLSVWFENKQSTDIYKPIWDDDEPHASVEFSAGYTHELIVALAPAVEQPLGVIGYEYGTTLVESYTGSERAFQPEIHNVEGKRFVVRIELIPKLWNDVRCKLPAFWFELDLESPEPMFAFVKKT